MWVKDCFKSYELQLLNAAKWNILYEILIIVFYFRDIIFLQNFSELTISLLPEKNKPDSAFKLVPDLTIAKVNMADT